MLLLQTKTFIQWICGTFFCFELHRFISIFDRASESRFGKNLRLDQFIILPVNLDLEAAACAESFNVAGGPRGGQGWEQFQNIVSLFIPTVRLQKHLGDAAGDAEIPIDLEGRVGI